MKSLIKEEKNLNPLYREKIEKKSIKKCLKKMNYKIIAKKYIKLIIQSSKRFSASFSSCQYF